jgi:hypothetical protein
MTTPLPDLHWGNGSCVPRGGTARLYGHPLACDNVQLHESAEALAKNGAASPHPSAEPRTHSPGCLRRQSQFGAGASQPSVRPPAQPIARNRNEEDNSQRLSAIHAVACLQVQTERTPLVVRDSVHDKRLTTGRREHCDFLRTSHQPIPAQNNPSDQQSDVHLGSSLFGKLDKSRCNAILGTSSRWHRTFVIFVLHG